MKTIPSHNGRNTETSNMRLSKYLKRLANDKAREERNRFDNFMKNNGWNLCILFMRGTKWFKDDVEIIIDRNGCHWNGEIITRDEMNFRISYTEKK